MTLLVEVMQRPLDPGYAAAAEARERDDSPGRDRRRAPLTTVLAVVAGALLVSAVLDLRLPGLVDERDVLQGEIETRTAEVDALETRLENLQAEIDSIGAEALAGAGPTAVEQAEQLGVAAGSTPVVGPGVEIVLDDADRAQDPIAGDGSDGDEADQGRVVDEDIVAVVNGLWAAGAESIAVNGQRLTAASAIRAAGDAILVNFRALSPPYRIVALGDPQGLQTELATSAAGRYLAMIQQTYGVRVSISGSNELELPGAQGLRLRYAEPPTDQEVSP